jgi:hypothetical protein
LANKDYKDVRRKDIVWAEVGVQLGQEGGEYKLFSTCVPKEAFNHVTTVYRMSYFIAPP